MEKEMTLHEYFAASSNQSKQLRDKWERRGVHVPLLMSANISRYCDMNCRSCLRDHIEMTEQEHYQPQITVHEWERVFREAEGLGVRFLFLMGGKPLRCKEILKRLRYFDKMVFSVFTNGTLMDEEHLQLFKAYPHISPLLNLAGCVGTESTPHSKGSHLYGSLMAGMSWLMHREIPYGAHAVMTGKNYLQLLDTGFLIELIRRKCETVIYMENGQGELSSEERIYVVERIKELRILFPEIQLWFRPREDKVEASSMAAGERFLQVTHQGYVEPHRMSGLARKNIREAPLEEILRDDIYERGII